MSYIYPSGVSPNDVWNYPTRTLTERFGIIERARGYASGFSKIYDETRFINAVLYLLGNNRGAIVVIPDDDIAYNKIFTILYTPSNGSAPSCFTDHNDTTGCGWYNVPTSLTDYFYVDMGSEWSGILRLLINFGYNGGYAIYGSNDASTWTQIYSSTTSSGTYEWFFYVSGYRYYKFSAYISASGNNLVIYSFEAYPDYALSYSKALNNLVRRIAVFVYNTYYQLLEVISL